MNNPTDLTAKNYKVLVLCETFNHSKYIKDALQGFAMQQTNFEYACLIIDDASTDGEQSVIKEWMKLECDMEQALYKETDLSYIIIVPHKHNSNCKFIFFLLKKNLYRRKEKEHIRSFWRNQCEYEALCEGDDYWTDALKLQKQVNYMDTHPYVTMVYTNFDTVTEKGELIHRDFFEWAKKQSILQPQFTEILISWNFIVTTTVLFRISIFNNSYLEKTPHYFDYSMNLSLAAEGKVYYINETTASYRLNPNSIMNSPQSELINNWAWDIKLFFLGLALNKKIKVCSNEDICKLLGYAKEIALQKWNQGDNSYFEYLSHYNKSIYILYCEKRIMKTIRTIKRRCLNTF